METISKLILLMCPLNPILCNILAIGSWTLVLDSLLDVQEGLIDPQENV